MDIQKWPTIIRDRVTISECTYGGTCEPSTSLTYHITADQCTIDHELGHAAAKILGIEQALGTLVWDTLGTDRVTNDNPFCYGAQCRERGHNRQAIAEYAADALAAYVNGQALPVQIARYIQVQWPRS